MIHKLIISKENRKQKLPTYEKLKLDNKSTRDDLALEIGVSENAIKQYLLNLQKEKLQRIGGRKEGYWKVFNAK